MPELADKKQGCASMHLSKRCWPQALHSRAEAALDKERAAHRNAKARISKAEERAAVERTARRWAHATLSHL